MRHLTVGHGLQHFAAARGRDLAARRGDEMKLKHWSRMKDRSLVIHHPRGTDHTEVPWVVLLDDGPAFDREVERVSGKTWIEPEAIEELVRYHEYLHAGN